MVASKSGSTFETKDGFLRIQERLIEAYKSQGQSQGVVRQGRFGPDVQRRAAHRKSIGPYGEDLRRSPAGQPPQGRRQQHEQYDSLFVHYRLLLFRFYSRMQRTGLAA